MFGKIKFSLQEVSELLESLPSESSDSSTGDDSSDVEVPANNLLKLSSDSEDDDEEIEQDPGSSNFYSENTAFPTSGFTPTDFFLQFIDEDIIENIAFQTNLYTTEKQNLARPVTTVNEIYGFIGSQFLFGYPKLHRNHLYWSSDVDKKVNVVQQTMIRN
ncbi:hypothetical protein TNCV_2838861 [Trichonephila clavipes]|nr:hypothetical protein TNCV_2838861 [Trichonephila clavipes]